MPTEVNLNFDQQDDGLNLTGVVNFPVAAGITYSTINIRGLAEWRHAPANIIHVNENFIEAFHMVEKSSNLSKVGINWIGIKARSNMLLSYSTRSGKTGTKKVQDLLTKFFKAIGATSVKFSVLDVDRAMQESNDNDNDDNDND